MRLAKSIAMVFSVPALALCLASGSFAQANALQKPASSATAKPAGTPAVKPAASTTTKPAAKPAARKTAATTKPTATKPATTKPTAGPVEKKSVAVNVDKKAPLPAGMTASPDQAPLADAGGPKRDPFVSLVNDRKQSGGPALPPGKAGLVVSTVRVDGTVRSGSELIAVVSNPDRHVYFVRQGDQLYDGSVIRIDLDGVTFHEESKDAFGKPIVRELTKRIYASAGEQQ
jgi:hypothetical protein